MCWRMAHGGHQATGTDEGRLVSMEGQSQGGVDMVIFIGVDIVKTLVL